MRAVGPRWPAAVAADHPWSSLLDHVDVLSLDVFDTAILRRVARPVDVFALVALDFRARRPEAAELDFAALRMVAEKRAREHAHGVEVTLDQIYVHLDVPDEWRAELRALELETERSLCTAHPETQRLYRAALRRGLPVVFLSDMYLPAEVVEEILARNGYADHAGVYVSSELGLTKSDGDLYDHVARDLGVAPHRILHIGDDRQSDVTQARRAGWTALHLRRPATPANGDLFSSLHAALVRERQHRGGDGFWARIGYQAVGPLYLGFASWVRAQAIARGCERVCFLARDGWILQQVYDRLGDGPPSSYLYASRRALNVPAIVTLGEAELDFLASGSTALRVRDYLSRIGLDPAAHEREIRAAGFSSVDDRLVGAGDERLHALFRALEPSILARAARERTLAVEYLRQEGLVDGGARKVAVVDLGWHGTLQRSLARLLTCAGASTQLTGMYLATFARARAVADEGVELTGYLSNFGASARWDAAIRACCEIWEFLHTAPHGSVVGFARGPRGVEPELAPHDAGSDQRRAAAELQAAALGFVDDALALLGDRAIAVSPDAAARPLERLVLDPTSEEAARFGDLQHGEGFGAATELRHLAAPPSWKARLGLASALRREHRSAYWPAGYRARLMATTRSCAWFASAR